MYDKFWTNPRPWKPLVAIIDDRADGPAKALENYLCRFGFSAAYMDPRCFALMNRMGLETDLYLISHLPANYPFARAVKRIRSHYNGKRSRIVTTSKCVKEAAAQTLGLNGFLWVPMALSGVMEALQRIIRMDPEDTFETSYVLRPEDLPMRISLKGTGVPEWEKVTVKCDISMSLLREDLCWSRGCLDEFRGHGLYELMEKFAVADPYEFPLSYRFFSIRHSLFNRFSITMNLKRWTGNPEIEPIHDPEGHVPGTTQAQDTLFSVWVDEDYRDQLTVYGKTADDALRIWKQLAPNLRAAIRSANPPKKKPRPEGPHFNSKLE